MPMTFVSVCRYLAIFNPIRSRLLFTARRVRLSLAFIWLLGMTLVSPLLFVMHTEDHLQIGVPVCRERWSSPDGKRVYGLFQFCVLYVLPVVFTTVTYSKIAFILWSPTATSKEPVEANSSCSRTNHIALSNIHSADRTRQTHHHSTFLEASESLLRNHPELILQRRRAVRLMFILVATFAALWLPYFAVLVWLDFSSNSVLFITTRVLPLVQWFTYANSAVNPLSYCFFSEHFRAGLRVLFLSSHRRTAAPVIAAK